MKRNLFVALLLLAIVLMLSACDTAWVPVDTGVEEVPASQIVVDAETPTVAENADVEATPAETGGLDTLLNFLLNLSGLVPVVAVGVFPIAFIVDLLKRLPKPLTLPNGWAPLASGILNLALFTAFFFLNNKHDEVLTGALQAFATMSPFILMLFMSMLGTSGAHNKLTDHGLGYSYAAAEVRALSRG